MIPFLDISRQYKNLREEILDASDAVYFSGQVLDGFFTQEFEDQIAKRCNRQFAVAVNSGTQALIFAQQALAITGKILIPAISFVATLNSVVMASNKPVIVDTQDNYLMDLHKASVCLEQRDIEALMYVNLYGNVVDYGNLRTMMDLFYQKDDVKIIEDAAQSFGASYNGIPSGKLGHVSVLSFDPTKNLNNYGSGGMVLTDDPIVYADLRDLRDNGKYLGFVSTGTNSKMSESDCAQMLVKLKHFDSWQSRRREIAEFYTEHISEYVDPVLPAAGVEHAWHKYVITTKHQDGYYIRDDLAQHLKDHGVATKIHYENTLSDYTIAGGSYDQQPTAARLCRSTLSLPIYPELTDSEVEYIAEKIVSFYTND
jgi:dTDP-4-amino-4,6-dideoxygalactose transaminase